MILTNLAKAQQLVRAKQPFDASHAVARWTPQFQRIDFADYVNKAVHDEIPVLDTLQRPARNYIVFSGRYDAIPLYIYDEQAEAWFGTTSTTGRECNRAKARRHYRRARLGS